MAVVATMLSITMLSGQDTPKEKKRNWTIGVIVPMSAATTVAAYTETQSYDRAWTYVTDGINYEYSFLTGLNLGYKGFNANIYWTFTKNIDEFVIVSRTSITPGVNESDYEREQFFRWSAGYQYTFGKKTDALIKPILGIGMGYDLNEVNFGIQYKRSQFLISAVFMPRQFSTLFPIVEADAIRLVNVKYQFLLF